MAHYAESLLATGEHIIRIQRQHWITLLDESKLAIAGLIVALVLFAATLAANVQGTGRDILGLITLVLLVLAIARIVWAYLRWTTNEYVLTNRRVMQVQGIVNKRTSDSSLEKINDAILTQSWIGRMFHFGDLEILTASESGIELMHMLVDAAGYKKGMLDAKHELELELARGGMPSPPLRAPGPMTPASDDRVVRTTVRGAPEPTIDDVPEPGEGVGRAAPAAGPAAAGPAVTGPAVGVPALDAPAAGAPAPSALPRPDNGSAASQPQSPARPMTADELTATLGRLADLRDRGAITPEEYEAKKRDLLSRL